jgi:curved DNA-binding protein CbpA
MAAGAPDPYKTLGVSPDVSDPELRAAYRRAVQLHHPDHNGGSAESTQRFEEVQEAYATIRRLRESRRGPPGGPSTTTRPDPGVDARLAEMERELAADRAERARAAKAARDRDRAREKAREAAREALDDQPGRRPTDEELGYIKTDDSFSKILSDAVSELSDQLGSAEKHVPKRVSDLIDELETKLGREPPKR